MDEMIKISEEDKDAIIAHIEKINEVFMGSRHMGIVMLTLSECAAQSLTYYPDHLEAFDAFVKDVKRSLDNWVERKRLEKEIVNDLNK